ncbi:Aspartyl protease family protein At5g10770 [Zea mays]|nr:Aspartyl protease family protein At5g10770 [Zea mays]ACN28327.1 unknown [Zea mays]|eukprot:NP_001168472.1 uncharacterized protein LOC100382248 [Zea mays]
MPVVHQHGPCSPLADNRNGKAPSHAEILAADQRRAEYIHRRVAETTGRARRRKQGAPVELRPGTPPSSIVVPSSSSATSTTDLPASYGVALGTGNYVVPVRLGTPAERFTVVFDTGSDTTWVQCQPCVAYCYRQKEPLFDPTKSATYANISCSSSYCSDLYVSGCSGGHCLYGIQYGDGSYTIGFYAQDTLTLAYDTIKNFRFGCGEKNRGLFGRAAGLLGLGRGKTSLPVQAYDKYGGVFAYCLPATSAGTGFLDLGPGAPAANARLTPMLVDRGPTFYYVGMTGIKVGGHVLPIPGSVFSTAGTLVDSGTVITRLPPSAYAPLRSAFSKAMQGLGYSAAPAFSILDTCYDLTGHKGGSIALPAVSLVFQGGACLDVDASGILYVADVSQACLAFAPNADDTDVAIVGNTQQKTHGVLYDIGKKIVGFAPGAC